MNFLVVDDNRLLNRFLVTFLRSKHHCAASLSDPTSVESWLVEHPCDAIILDIGMPEMNGIDLLGKIRPKYPDLVIIIFTGMGYEEDLIAAARAAGANGYVSKGLGPSELYKTIIRIISIKKET